MSNVGENLFMGVLFAIAVVLAISVGLSLNDIMKGGELYHVDSSFEVSDKVVLIADEGEVLIVDKDWLDEVACKYSLKKGAGYNKVKLPLFKDKWTKIINPKLYPCKHINSDEEFVVIEHAVGRHGNSKSTLTTIRPNRKDFLVHNKYFTYQEELDPLSDELGVQLEFD